MLNKLGTHLMKIFSCIFSDKPFIIKTFTTPRRDTCGWYLQILTELFFFSKSSLCFTTVLAQGWFNKKEKHLGPQDGLVGRGIGLDA